MFGVGKIKKYQTKPEIVEACQYDGTWKSLVILEKESPNSLSCDNHNHYFNNIRLTKDCWIVKQVDFIASRESGKGMYKFIVMRDDQFKVMYEEWGP